MTTTGKTRMATMPRRALLAGTAALVGAAAAAAAAGPALAQSRLVDMQVIDRESGQAARVWRQGGRLFVAGRPGARYGLRVRNLTGRRVLVVMSVDGVNILTGETAAVGQRGYVFAPYESYDVTGWRKSDTEVAAFTFAPLSRSYAAQTGRPGDVGVIGLAAFTERYYAPPPEPPRPASVAPDQSGAADSVEETVVTGTLMRSAPAAAPPPAARAAPSPYAPAPQLAEKLGTGHGRREWSSVTLVDFERATSAPQQVSRVEYDSTENLIARGVIPRRYPTPQPPRPRPFPGSSPGYVPDPP